MKITEENINHNMVRLIEQVIEEPFDYCGDGDEFDRMRCEKIACVKGILIMGQCMKEVIKT